ncbi:MAG: pseudaminic acid cytidylyltransferase [Kiritimatiellae bacterium]|nr:pseudaminic acid cytidylyltransferase [Kiritimatiellia bacterium]
MMGLITARGGSRGLPGKNILSFCGKPLIAYTVEAALQSGCFDNVLVSTDSREIADVCLKYGAEVPFLRPAHLAADDAKSRDVVLHALDFMEQKSPVESICLLQPTSPLRSAEDIRQAVSVFRRNSADSVISVTEYSHPIQWAVSVSEDGKISEPSGLKPSRRQDQSVCYHPNGAIYIFNAEFIRRSEGYIGKNTYALIMPPERSVDIDTPFDFMLAEFLFTRLREKDD